MTDPLTRLRSRPEHMQTREWLESELRREQSKGVHTVHDCDCRRMWCRGKYCADCLREMLEVAE